MKKSIAAILVIIASSSFLATCTYKESKGTYDISYSSASEHNDSTGRTNGQILDLNTGKPIIAHVLVLDTYRGAYSNPEGLYWIDIPPGIYRLRARLYGRYYAIITEEVRVTPGNIAIVNFKLKKIPKPSLP